jgi:hypothetical protein
MDIDDDEGDEEEGEGEEEEEEEEEEMDVDEEGDDEVCSLSKGQGKHLTNWLFSFLFFPAKQGRRRGNGRRLCQHQTTN